MTETSQGEAPAEKPLDELVAEIDNRLGDVSGDISGAFVGKGAAGTGYEAAADHCIKFAIDDIRFAVSLSDALEIGHRLRVTPLPNLPNWVIGVINVRGEIISIVALNAFFGISAPRIQRNQRFIIIHSLDMKVGILVDRVFGIITVDSEKVGDGPRFYQDADAGTHRWAEFVSGIFVERNELINILDVSLLLASPKMDAFRSK